MAKKKGLAVGCTIFASTGELTTEVRFVQVGVIIAPQYCPNVTIQQLDALAAAAQKSSYFREYELHQGNEGNIVISIDVPAAQRGASVMAATRALAELIRVHLELCCTIQTLKTQLLVRQILGGRTECTHRA